MIEPKESAVCYRPVPLIFSGSVTTHEITRPLLCHFKNRNFLQRFFYLVFFHKNCLAIDRVEEIVRQWPIALGISRRGSPSNSTRCFRESIH